MECVDKQCPDIHIQSHICSYGSTRLPLPLFVSTDTNVFQIMHSSQTDRTKDANHAANSERSSRLANDIVEYQSMPGRNFKNQRPFGIYTPVPLRPLLPSVHLCPCPLDGRIVCASYWSLLPRTLCLRIDWYDEALTVLVLSQV